MRGRILFRRWLIVLTAIAVGSLGQAATAGAQAEHDSVVALVGVAAPPYLYQAHFDVAAPPLGGTPTGSVSFDRIGNGVVHVDASITCLSVLGPRGVVGYHVPPNDGAQPTGDYYWVFVDGGTTAPDQFGLRQVTGPATACGSVGDVGLSSALILDVTVVDAPRFQRPGRNARTAAGLDSASKTRATASRSSTGGRSPSPRSTEELASRRIEGQGRRPTDRGRSMCSHQLYFRSGKTRPRCRTGWL